LRRDSTQLRNKARLALAVLLAFLCIASSAQAQTVADPNFWKQTEERADTAYRFFYAQSPQTIPAEYSPVAEAEQILRSHQASLPTSSPEAKSILRRGWDVLTKERLAPRPGPLFGLALAPVAFEVGWKIGSGINAKLLRLGLPGSDDPSITNPRLQFVGAGTALYTNHIMPYDGWVFTFDTPCCNGINQWGEYVHPDTDKCSKFIVQPPDDWGEIGEILRSFNNAQCWRGWFEDPPTAPTNTLSAIAPENAVVAPTPAEDYTDQPYTYETPAPTPPPQTTVEQGIEDELAKAENELLRDWLNYHLGAPNAQDPVGNGPQNASIRFDRFEEHFADHGHQFPEYSDAWEYWQGAVEVVERGDRSPSGGEGVLRCERSDGALVYWDVDRGALVILEDGNISTFFKPSRGFDYWDDECKR
jgi:hypothetical protein